jgi:hypothetical protein
MSVQTNIEARGRANVADYTLFADAPARRLADSAASHDARLKHAVAVGDAKQWSIGLDQAGGGAGYKGDAGRSDNSLPHPRRGCLGSGGALGHPDQRTALAALFQRRPSLLDGYFKVDFAWAIGLPGTQGDLLGHSAAKADDNEERDRLFRSLLLFFRRAAFQPATRLGNRTLPQYAFDEGRLWETKVRTDLSDVVFDQVFPGLIRAFAATDPAAPDTLTPIYLNRVCEALTMLYRLLFALHAEGRDLLPARDPRLDNNALSPIRDEIEDRVDRGDPITNRSTRY